ncbi:AsmA family protein [Ramlibacter henchirensis]|uniref:AsmA family protein n=1 Tax=Ramlibacter henchirensis TaxID=204072 RepID=A0A4Z0BXL7_9BURK|nr:AsmA family protein [Ramlibacter henchirensis]TFZ03028.1 AsmA family protein [Ramlibacter henchirensis]
MSTAAASPLRNRLWFKVVAGIVLFLLALVLLAVFFPWDTLRGPVNRYVTEKTGRQFEITRHLDVKLGRTTRVIMDGIEFANPQWAQDRHLVKAERAEVEVRLWPLLFRREIVLPSIHLTKPQLGLQIEPDGRRTWALGEDTKDERNVPSIGALVIDEGSAHYVARHQGADIRLQFAMDRQQAQAAATSTGSRMPLRFKADGRWREQAFNAEGRTGDVLYLSAPLQQPFPAEVHANAGGTQLHARGSIASLATLDGANVNFQLQGPNLAELYRLVGVTLPDTPPYSVAGQLSKQGEVWRVREIGAKLGKTDMAGELAFDNSQKVPQLAGKLQSRTLDFEDLAPVIGLKDERRGPPGEQQRVAKAQPQDAKARDGKKEPKDPNRKVLPGAPLDVSRLNSMNADVRVDAARVVNAKGLPLDRMGVHVRLQNGLLVLDPLDLGVAGGRVAGQVRIDSNAKPVAVQTRLDARSLELNRLFPKSESARNSFGKIQGQVDLTARGGSVAQMLANANGNVALLMGRGEISNILLEFAGLDGGEILKFLARGDKRVELRCAATAFDVKDGVMTSRALVLDTDDTVFHGGAEINLARESMNALIKPQPKDTSILSLRSPLKVAGTFGAPDVGLEKSALAGRAALAIGLGAINPLLALAATIETGPGKDADCVGTLKEAAASRAETRVGKSAPPAEGPGTKPSEAPAGTRMGAGPAPNNSNARAAGNNADARRPGNTQAAARAPAADALGTGTPGKPIAP